MNALPNHPSPSCCVLVPVAPGFEEIEMIVPVDVWRRARWQVTVAGLNGGEPIRASRETLHLPDAPLDEVLDQAWDLIYLPGGRPGADYLRDHTPLIRRLQAHDQSGGWLAAICAAPIVLDRAGLLDGRSFTCHPSAIGEISSSQRSDSRLVTDGKLITGVAAGAAMELALAVLNAIAGPARVAEVNQGLLAPV